MKSGKNQDVKNRINSVKNTNSEPVTITKEEYELLKEANMDLDYPVVVERGTISDKLILRRKTIAIILILCFIVAVAVLFESGFSRSLSSRWLSGHVADGGDCEWRKG